MLNRVVLVGRLTRDPELRYTPSGVAVANFNIAVNRPFSNQQGEREADFINGVVWRNAAENLANYMQKGNLIGIDGRIQTRNFEGQDGKRVYVTEVVADSIQFLESRNSGGSGNGNNYNQNNNTNNSSDYRNNQGNNVNNSSSFQNNRSNDPFRNNGQPIDISDDDLPF